MRSIRTRDDYLRACGVAPNPGTRAALDAVEGAIRQLMDVYSRADAEEIVRRMASGTHAIPKP